MSNHNRFFENLKEWFTEKNDNRVFSDEALRFIVGILAFILPWALILYTMKYGNCESDVLPSISDYFHSKGRDVFVGILSAVCLAFLVYQGYDKRDTIFSKIACVSCFCIIIFPTMVDCKRDCHIYNYNIENCEIAYSEIQNNQTINCNLRDFSFAKPECKSMLHYISAGVFFGCLVIFCLYLFPLSYQKKNWEELSLRNKTRKTIYISCGLGIFLCMFMLYAYSKSTEPTHDKYDTKNPVFWLEAIMLFLFGISWFTKSQIIFADEEDPDPPMIAVD